MQTAWNPADFWQFSLVKYEQRAAFYLDLQNRLALNVNLVLLCEYADSLALSFNSSAWERLRLRVDTMDRVITVVRKQRQQLGSHSRHSQSYQSLKQQELSLEARQQCLLIDAAHGFLEPQKPQDLSNWQRLLELQRLTPNAVAVKK